MEKKREKPELIGDIRLANKIILASCSLLKTVRQHRYAVIYIYIYQIVFVFSTFNQPQASSNFNFDFISLSVHDSSSRKQGGGKRAGLV